MKIFKFKTIRFFIIVISTFMISVMPRYVVSATFFKTGLIDRTLSDSNSYGGCMIRIDTNISNGCPDNGWVSFDCRGRFSQAENGKRSYASALVAFSLGKRISVLVNNANKINNYCVARRVDILQ